MTRYLSSEDLLTLAEDLGVGPVRDIGLLDSAAHRPQASVFGEDAYPSLERKAAALLESLLRNHPLVDGNKRLGWLAMLVFLEINGARIDVPDELAYDFVISVATGDYSLDESALCLTAWLRDFTVQ